MIRPSKQNKYASATVVVRKKDVEGLKKLEDLVCDSHGVVIVESVYFDVIEPQVMVGIYT